MNKSKLKSAHILLVEDNEGDVLLTKEAFSASKVKTEVSVARNGQEALDFLFQRGEFKDAKRPDIVLLDINMPIYNGHEVLERIKSNETLKKIPVVILTTSSSKGDLELAYKNHCNSFVEKPLNIEDFLKAILKIEEFWLQLTLLSD